MKILALDIATRTGVAVGSVGGSPSAWAYDLKAKTEEEKLSNALRMTHGLILAHKPDLIACEAAVGGAQASSFLIGLLACVRGCAFNQGVQSVSVANASIRKHFLGKHYTMKHFPELARAQAQKRIKGMVVDRCRLMGWHVEGHDEADALALWDYSCAHYGGNQAAPLGELFGGAA